MRFRYEFVVEAPLELVSAFHANPAALERLTPPPVRLRWEHLEPVAEGSVVRFVLHLGPFPIRWAARHRAVSPFGFTDEQLEGPFRRWVHTHRFEPRGAQRTAILEEIEAEWPRHPIRWILATAIWMGLPMLFAYRARKLQALVRHP
jgi:ligand-binding SRPBCC domain-containing protein